MKTHHEPAKTAIPPMAPNPGQRLEAIEKRVAALEAHTGIPGPAGHDGKPGERGPKGERGEQGKRTGFFGGEVD